MALGGPYAGLGGGTLVACKEEFACDPRTLDTLYRAHFDAVLSQCRRILRNDDDAADATHEVFLRALEVLPTDRGLAEMRPWLLTVARNRCIDLIRQRKRLVRIEGVDQVMPERVADPERTTIARYTAATVMAGLRLRERQALWQSAVEGQPLAGIAQNLGLSYMAAAQLLHRAKRRALLVAAQVAAFIWVFNRRQLSGMGTAARLAAVVAVPALAIAIPSATPPPGAAASVAPTIAAPHSVTVANPGGPAPIDRAAQSGAASTLSSLAPPAVGTPIDSSVLSAAVGAVDAQLAHVRSTLPIQAPSPLPTPKLP